MAYTVRASSQQQMHLWVPISYITYFTVRAKYLGGGVDNLTRIGSILTHYSQSMGGGATAARAQHEVAC